MQFLDNVWEKPYELHTATVQNIGSDRMSTCL